MFKTILIVIATAFTLTANAQAAKNANTTKVATAPQEQVQAQVQTINIPATLLIEKGTPNGKLRWVKGMALLTFTGNQISEQKFFVDTRSSNPDKRWRPLKEDEKVWAFTTVNYSKVGN